MRRPSITILLVLANLAVFTIEELRGGSERPDVLIGIGAMVPDLIRDYSQSWRLLSASFIHIGPWHLVLNVVLLLFVGRVVERHYGGRRFFVLYVISALGGAIASYSLGGGPIAAGASGAVFGLLGAGPALRLRHREPVRLEDSGVLLALLGLVIALNVRAGIVNETVDSWNHVGGLLAGFAAALILDPRAETARVGEWSVNALVAAGVLTLGYAGVAAATNSVRVADPMGEALVRYFNEETLEYRRGFGYLADQAGQLLDEPPGPNAVARLKHEILPSADRLLEKVRHLEPEHPAIRKVHASLQRQSEAFGRALILVGRAASGSAVAARAAPKALQLAREKYEAWQNEVSALARRRGLTL